MTSIDTDIEWKKWGLQDPYFAVLTDPRYRSGNLDEEGRRAFFETGRNHFRHVLASCRRIGNPGFVPSRALDFGCGVGRVTLPIAEVASAVVGVDVSEAMLAEAARNRDAQGLTNVEFVLSDDGLTRVEGSFDFVHTAIVLQHIDVPRGLAYVRRLLDCLAPGGHAVLQLTYGKAYHPETFGQPPLAPDHIQPPRSTPWWRRALLRRPRDQAPSRPPAGDSSGQDPVMLMNPYNLSEVAYLLQSAGIGRFEAEFTDHGGELGVFIYCHRP